MPAALVPIIVTESYGQPDGTETPVGSVGFQLTDEIIAPQVCAAKYLELDLVAGAIAQQLVANDLDSTGAPLDPQTTMFGVTENIDGAAEVQYFITVPAVPPGSRTVHDAAMVANGFVLTSATADFTDDDVGAYVLVNNGAAVPPGTWIASVTNSTTATLSQATSSSSDLTGLAVMVGASATLSELRPSE